MREEEVHIGSIRFSMSPRNAVRLKRFISSLAKKANTESKGNLNPKHRIAFIAYLLSVKTGEENYLDTEDIDGFIQKFSHLGNVDMPVGNSQYADVIQRTSALPKDTVLLYRNEKQKIIGGVAAGVAHYFGTDPVFIRLVFLFALYNASEVMFFWYLLPIAYFTAWLLLPGSSQLVAHSGAYWQRNTDQRVIAGVARGGAKFFSIDETLIRAAFVALSFFFGLGVLIYLILWLVIPAANPAKDKIYFYSLKRGFTKPAQSIALSLHTADPRESRVGYFLYLPFQMVEFVIDFSRRQELINFRSFQKSAKAAGVLMLLIGSLSVFLSLSLTLFALTNPLGMSKHLAVPLNALLNYFFNLDYQSLTILSNSIPAFSVIAVFISLGIPVLFLIRFALQLLNKRLVGKYLNRSLAVIWVSGISTVAFVIPAFIADFRTSATHKTSQSFELPSPFRIVVFEDTDLRLAEVKVFLREHAKEKLEVVKSYSAMGTDRLTALNRAQQIQHEVVKINKALVIPKHFHWADSRQYRGEQLDIYLYIPEGKQFSLSEAATNFIEAGFAGDRKMIRRHKSHILFFKDYKIYCADCSLQKQHLEKDVPLPLTVPYFNSLAIKGNFRIKLQNGGQHQIEFPNSLSSFESVYSWSVSPEGLLSISPLDSGQSINNGIVPEDLIVTSPNFNDVNIVGLGILDFDLLQQTAINISMKGSFTGSGKLLVEALNLDIVGASRINLGGSVKSANMQLSGKVQLQADSLRVGSLSMVAKGLSHAYVHPETELFLKVGPGSRVDYDSLAGLSVKRIQLQ